jgi:acyl-coenzyme A thioesterase PaaI-like protein
MSIRDIENPYLDIEGYNCFGCSPRNDIGLKLKFKYDEETDEVFTFIRPRAEYCGYPGVLHGGIQASMLDEAAYWAVHMATGKPALTTRLDMELKRAVVLPAEVEIRAGVTALKRKIARVEARILVEGELKAQAKITYYVADPEQWERIAGKIATLA